MKDIKQIKAAVLAQNPDVKRFRNRRLTAFFVKLIAVEAVVVALTSTLIAHGVVAAIPVGVVLALLLPFLALKAHEFLVFGVRLGKVVNIKIIQKRVSPNDGYAHSINARVVKNFAIFTLEDENGRIKKIELEARFHECIYEGDTLLRLAGVPYPINLKRHTKALCPICGNIMPRESTRCVGCNADAVQSRENFEEHKEITS